MTPPTPEQVAALEQWARDRGARGLDLAMMEATVALCETVREMQAEEREARTVLWLRHGHTGQYGDDGEMQCGACVPFYDYKRRRLSDVASTALLASQNTRDAAVARAEQAEWERDALERHRDELHERWSSEQARAAILQVAVGERTAERDAARDEVAEANAAIEKWVAVGNSIMRIAVGREAPLSDSDVEGVILSLRAELAQARAELEQLRTAAASGWGEPTLVNMLKVENATLRAEIQSVRALLAEIAQEGR